MSPIRNVISFSFRAGHHYFIISSCVLLMKISALKKMFMATQVEKPHITLYSTRDELLINSNFPPLELYGEDKKGLEKAYIDWLKKERLGKNVCYIDLTFELPPKGLATLSIVPPNNNFLIYKSILEGFISSDHTLYPHTIFQEGIPGYYDEDGTRQVKTTDPDSKDDEYSESFFLHEIKENISKSETKVSPKFLSDDIKIDDFYKKAVENAKNRGEKYSEIIDNKPIEVHWSEWVNLHIKLADKGKSLISNAGGFLRWILVIPIGIVSDNKKYKNIGSIFLGMDSNCEKDEVVYFSRSLVLLLLSSSQRYYEKSALSSATKSAIAAVMSRNMSHNLGSHVFYYTRQELLDIYEKEKAKDKKWTYLQDIKGLAWFLHYVQERQDFIANINSNDKYPFGPLNLKQDVIDEMTPDAVDVRHNSEPMTKNFLLENIVRSENIKRRETGAVDDLLKNIDIEIILENEAKSGNQKDETNYVFSTWIAKDVTNFYEIDFAVNCGQQSRHAFLILLENIIRNSAKHGFSPFDNKDLLISIKIESNKEQYQITIYDNASNAYDLKEISTKNGVREISNLVNLQQNLKGIRMLDEDYLSINRDNKGLKEILISILWMKGYELNQIETYAKDETVLSIIDVKNESDNNIANIGYRFSLPKFKDLVELNDKDIFTLLRDNLIVKFGSIYSVKDYAIEQALEDNHIKTKFGDSANMKRALSKRIPRILFNDDGVTNSCKQLYQSKYNDFQNHIISFDRLTSKTIDSLKDLVKLIIPNDRNAKIQFVNHLSKSEENLKEHISPNKQQRINHYRKPDVILESISGANQIFNLFQKFQANNYAITNNIIENKLHDLYWNILDAYNTVIFIIDERLSYKNDGMCFDSYVIELLEAKIDVEKFIDACFIAQEITYQDRLNEIINLKESKQIKGKKIIELLDVACYKKHTSDLCLHSNMFEAEIEHIPFLPQNIKERFLQQQNTYLFNLNTDHRLINSLGEYDSGSITEIDFFSIHIGLLDKMSGTDMINKIREVLKTNKIEPRFISVHSGRGGLNSKEEKITFLPFSVLQRCLEDSKFVLSEFFNNYKYIPFN